MKSKANIPTHKLGANRNEFALRQHRRDANFKQSRDVHEDRGQRQLKNAAVVNNPVNGLANGNRGPSRVAAAKMNGLAVGGLRERKVAPKFRAYYQQLLSLQTRLCGDRGELIKDAQQDLPVEPSADAAADESERQLTITLLTTERDALFEIEEALRRIIDGSYGICEVTGKRIPPKRLRAIPWTRFSLGAQANFESHGEHKTLS